MKGGRNALCGGAAGTSQHVRSEFESSHHVRGDAQHRLSFSISGD